MTRVLVFDGERGATRFQLIWMALFSSDGKSERGAAIIRREARLQTSFEAISEPVAAPNPGEPDRALVSGGAVVTLAQEDFDLLQQCTEKTPWLPRASRDVVDLWDFLSAAEKRE
jgi:hypothetical protein